jgi:hypothetical protein
MTTQSTVVEGKHDFLVGLVLCAQPHTPFVPDDTFVQ